MARGGGFPFALAQLLASHHGWTNGTVDAAMLRADLKKLRLSIGPIHYATP
jgi:hypothetical protein